MMNKSTLQQAVKYFHGCFFIGALVVSTYVSATAVYAVSDEDCKIATTALEKAAEIRGLKVQKRVPCRVHDKDKVKKYLLHAINEKIPAKKLKMEEVVYKALGFFKEDFKYKEGLIDLYLGQIGGYYDPEKKHYVMAKWLPALLQPTIAVHELTHALQDQYYNLEPFMDPEKYPSDTLYAHSALVEGDASAVMYDYNRNLTMQQPLENDENVDMLIAQSLMSVAMTNSTQGAPEGLVLLLVFPYTSGLRFAHALLREGGYEAIDKAYERPPQSTEEILHPEKYFKKGTDFQVFEEKDLFPKGNVQFSDRLGEFFMSVWLRTLGYPAEKAAEASKGWGGDLIAVTPGEGDSCHILWKTAWDTQQDAKEFHAAVKEVLAVAGSGKELKKSLSSTRKLTLKHQDIIVELHVDYSVNCS